MNEKQGITVTKKQIAIIAAVTVALLIGGILLGLNWKNWFGDSDSSSAANTTSQSAGIELDENAGEYTGEQPQNKSPESAVGIKIPGYPTITIEKDKQDVKMALLNPEGNPCYFKFVIELKDSGEKIFESKYVKPGDCIYDVHLGMPLAEGSYPAVIKITTVSLDGKTPLNGANVETVIIAK